MSLSPHMAFPLSAHRVSVEFAVVSSLKDTNPTESGPLPYDLINLSHILRGLISTYEFRASTYELREGYRYSVHNNILIKQCLAPQPEDLHRCALIHS